MYKRALFYACAFFAVAIVIFVFADGARRFYAGGLFVVLGIVMLVNAKRAKASRAQASGPNP